MAKQSMPLDTTYRYGTIQKRRKGWIIAFVVVLILFLFSTFVFNISKIEINGNHYVSDEEIKEELGVAEGMNMFAFLFSEMVNKAELNPLIASADVHIHWPNTVRIEIGERNIVGYVAYMGMYLCIDETGYIVDSTHAIREDMPIVTGVNIQNFALGEPISTSSTSLSQLIMRLCALIKRYELSGEVVRIDLTDMDDIRLFTDVLEVRFGSDDGLSLKTQALALVLRKTPGANGILHLEDMDGQIYLEQTV